METEIKFALSPDARARIEQHARPLALVGETSHIDHTTYFDTAGQTLRKAGFSLRVRHRLESGGYVQTVKSVGNGTLHRREWEWPVAAPRPDLARLAEVEALPTLSADGLQPVFRTEVNRSRFVLAPAAGTKLELALDEGAVVADNKSEPLSEMEIELKAGSEDVLFRVGLDFLTVAPLALLNESKAERGYSLLGGSGPAARTARPIVLDPDSSVPAAFRCLAEALLDHLLANQPAALRGDTREGVHQMRVAIRRLRSLLVLFDHVLEPHPRDCFDVELRRLGQLLGAPRDWDVFLDETLPRAVKDTYSLRWVEPLRALAAQRQHAAHQAAKKAVFEPAFTRFVLAFEAWSRSIYATLPRIDRPLKELAPGMLSRLSRKVDKRLEAMETADPASRHELRKSAKKLRYAIEYFEGLYGDAAGAYHKRCNALQKRLGVLNDLATMTRLASELTTDGRIDLAPALGILDDRGNVLAAKALRKLDTTVRKFERQAPFWK